MKTMQNTLQALQKKRKSRKGFTLMEMLIVVAIIAVLVAIAIPVFSAQLNTAKERVDAANLRSATSMAVTDYLSNSRSGSITYVALDSGNDTMAVAIKDSEDDTKKYYSSQATVNQNKNIKVVISDGGKVDQTNTGWK